MDILKGIVMAAFIMGGIQGEREEGQLDQNQVAAILGNASVSENIVEYTIQDFADDELESWEPPFNFTKRFPYFLSGYDEERRPIWVAEWGRWDLRRVVEAGDEEMEAYDKYNQQICLRALRSVQNSANPDYPTGEGILIVDAEGLDVRQLTSLPTLRYLLKLTRQYRFLLVEHLGQIYIINTNYVTSAFITLTRSVLGDIFDRIEVLGNNKARWIPELLKRFPKDQLPPWYGGNKDFKPVKVYG